METKTMGVGRKQIKLYRCPSCFLVPTWVSDRAGHHNWHKLRAEKEQELAKIIKAGEGSGGTVQHHRIPVERATAYEFDIL